MYIVKTAYLGCDWKWHRDKTTPVYIEVARKIADLNARYFNDLLTRKIIKDYRIEITENDENKK